MPEKAIIIGAGAYGLALGCYLQMNGFETEIFEMHDQPGGLCTAWKRQGYTFDACIHWLMGSGPGTNMHEMWRELHAVQDRRFVEWDEYMRVRLSSGETFTVYTDPAKLEAEMRRLAPDPADGRLIHDFCATVLRASRADLPVTTEKMGLPEKLRLLLPFVALGPALRRWGSMNVETFCARFRSRPLAEALSALYGGSENMPDFPVTATIMMLAFMHRRSCGYPVGGSLEFARAIERRYLELGGRVRYRTRVERILVEGEGSSDRAVGVAAGGEEHRADEVISCADGHATLFELLGGRYLSPELRRMYESHPTFPSLIYVSLGVARDLSGLPAALVFPLAAPIAIEDGARTLKTLGARLFHFDPTAAPQGRTAVTVMIESRGFEYWSELRKGDPDRYRAEKKRIAEAVVDALEAELGDFKRHVEVVDVATPATWHRYTGNWRGSYEGFLPTRDTMMKSLPFTVPGLACFHVNGQWVSIGGGLPPAGMNGRKLAGRLCRKYGRKFRTVP